jgi:hypothetical protein
MEHGMISRSVVGLQTDPRCERVLTRAHTIGSDPRVVK